MKNEARVCEVTRRAGLGGICGALFLAFFSTTLAAQQRTMERQQVESSVLATVGYDAAQRCLEIEFHSGAIYRYFEVPAEMHARLLRAESKGRFFGANIRDKFRSLRVDARPEK